MFDYTDNDAHNLLSEILKYAEAFSGNHGKTPLTVDELVKDLVESSDSGNQARFTTIQGRINSAFSVSA